VSRFNVLLDRTSQFTYIFVCYHCISVHNVDQFGWICVIFTPSPIGEQSIMMSVSVCVSVCLSAIISSELHVQSCNQFFVHDNYGRGSVLVWWCSDVLCISGSMDDVIFAHKLKLLNIAAWLRQRGSHTALGLVVGIPVAGSGRSIRSVDMLGLRFV